MWLWTHLFVHPPPAWRIALAGLGVTLVVAWACAEAITAMVRRSLARSAARGTAAQQHARTTARVVRVVSLVLFTAVFIAPALELLGQPLRAGLRLRKLGDWAASNGLKVVLIAGVAYVLVRAIDLVTSQFERHLTHETPASAEQSKRARTLGEMTRNVATAVITGIALLYILKALDIDIMPLLTTAGIAGLAIGFGAQTLVKDLISGFFLIFDNQVRVGDVAEINGTAGLVESLHLRTLVLRDARGALHFFQTGAITTLANLTKDFSYALLDVQVQHKADAEKVLGVLERTSDALRQDPEFRALVLDPLEVLGVDNQGPDAVTIRVRIKTLPMRQWDVARELRHRVRHEVGYEGIDIPIGQPLPGVKPR